MSGTRLAELRRQPPDSVPAELVRAGDLVREAQRRVELLFETAPAGGREAPAGRRGLCALVGELQNLTTAAEWKPECEVLGELLLLLESPSKLVGLTRKLRAGLTGLEQRLWDRLTARLPSLLSQPEWERRVA